jgi:hypothetical protein
MLSELFNKYGCDKSKKHMYHLVYEPIFEKIRYENLNILEIGIFKGNSIQAWLEYFPNATIYGVDIFTRVDPRKIEILNHPRVKWAKCDSTISNVKEWEDVKFDIIIDDGLHTPEANLKTFNSFKNQLKGSFFIEDVWPLNIMNSKELKDNWINNKPEYTIEKYNEFLNEISKYKSVEHYDLRSKTKKLDSYIIKVSN